ncbi:Bax inhibitor-1/YccA family protein [Aeromicrobium sp. Leaf350]|uniref:Bax inhibitor-1/YccA family protein n=1 Tax=Aeromicrobium sp. Leaf350 TaxID=2876565 RepID=UPI001E3CEF76|nr:Bax inhibitor-1/YccA family protein [Aeromicrobium sp. Leaf350]
MHSSNPVFSRNDAYNGRSSSVQTDPSQWTVDTNAQPGYAPPAGASSDRMTIDSVVEKTAVTLGIVVAAAAVAWVVIGQVIVGENSIGQTVVDQAALNRAFAFAAVGAIVGLVLSLVNSFKKVISPALVIAYAVFQGVFVGALSKVVSTYVGDVSIVFQAIVGTFVAFGATLAAYKFFNIQVTDRFRKVVTIAVFAFAGAVLLNLLLSVTGVVDDGGLRGFNMLGLAVSAIAVVLAVLMLVLDFDYVEKGVEAGLPQRESWRAAFGLTVTLIWLYIEILRILAILRGSD